MLHRWTGATRRGQALSLLSLGPGSRAAFPRMPLDGCCAPKGAWAKGIADAIRFPERAFERAWALRSEYDSHHRWSGAAAKILGAIFAAIEGPRSALTGS